ncbi:hypothetical protein HYALB_00010894 [Hymenoscyphus albidus]|uniref:Uncharacterized protein n=1 Tax=Hymenoscyphus albidus TaxID=595503 RepID=A0A9N9LRU2_9HELO|nr:hypothetical protein HYALB_00010894 [Hymenoscyphus albidus]
MKFILPAASLLVLASAVAIPQVPSLAELEKADPDAFKFFRGRSVEERSTPTITKRRPAQVEFSPKETPTPIIVPLGPNGELPPNPDGTPAKPVKDPAKKKKPAPDGEDPPNKKKEPAPDGEDPNKKKEPAPDGEDPNKKKEPAPGGEDPDKKKKPDPNKEKPAKPDPVQPGPEPTPTPIIVPRTSRREPAKPDGKGKGTSL